jgi:hypothetical protein
LNSVCWVDGLHCYTFPFHNTLCICSNYIALIIRIWREYAAYNRCTSNIPTRRYNIPIVCRYAAATAAGLCVSRRRNLAKRNNNNNIYLYIWCVYCIYYIYIYTSSFDTNIQYHLPTPSTYIYIYIYTSWMGIRHTICHGLCRQLLFNPSWTSRPRTDVLFHIAVRPVRPFTLRY